MGFKENLKRLRQEHGMTQLQLGNAVGVYDRTIQKYETGQMVPKTEVAIKLAKVLEVSIEQLMDMEDLPEPKEDAIRYAKGVSALFYGGRLSPEDKKKVLRIINDAYIDSE